MAEFRRREFLMGSAFSLLIHHPDEKHAHALLDAGIKEIRRLEDRLSEFRPASDISRINAAAGGDFVEADRETVDLLRRSIDISRMSSGAFDITVGPLKGLYDFKGGPPRFPDKRALRDALSRVGYERIEFSGDTGVRLPRRGMRISLAAIAKGTAADRVKALWRAEGISSGVIDASGDITVLGTREDGRPWQAGIADPDDRSSMLFFLPLRSSIATSGDAVQFFIHRGQRYSHNLDPRTGKPVMHLRSVSVISPSAELSDALATAVTVMGKDAGIRFIDQLPDTHGLIVDDLGAVHASQALHIEH